MKVTFVSNYLTHHQKPFCDCMYAHMGEKFTFVSTMPMENERVEMGWTLGNCPKYEVNTYTSDIMTGYAKKRIIESDVVILGAVSQEIIDMRINNSDGVTFRYCERIFKSGIRSALAPGSFRYRFDYHKKMKNKKVYILCASAYLTGDLKLLQSYKNRCYRWGYFPPVRRYEQVAEHKDCRQILWVGRMIKWKHPEMMIKLAKELQSKGYDFSIKLIGDGSLYGQIQEMISSNNLEDCVTMLGNMPHSEVRKHMAEAGIFVATSDFNEGWGAVVNEAMNDGCAVVASHAMGSVPFLIQDGVNGLIFKSESESDLFRCVAGLLNDSQKVVHLGKAAYSTIVSTWNAENATERFINLATSLLEGSVETVQEEGPCSKAPVLFNNWK